MAEDRDNRKPPRVTLWIEGTILLTGVGAALSIAAGNFKAAIVLAVIAVFTAAWLSWVRER